MENNDINVTEEFNSNLPATVKMSATEFLTQKIYLTPEQIARRQALSDFWHYEIDEEKATAFLFQKMNF